MSSFNLTKEIRYAYDAIREFAINQKNTLIFGGEIRDRVLRNFHTKKFWDSHKELEKEMGYEHVSNLYWDKNYHPETKLRLIIPNDLDICFKSMDDLNYFVDTIKIKFIHVICEINMKQVPLYGILPSYLNHYVCIIECRANTSFSDPSGIYYEIKIDAVISEFTEPPFGKPDFLSNILVEDEFGIRLSKNVGSNVFNDRPVKVTDRNFKCIDVMNMIIRRENKLLIWPSNKNRAKILKKRIWQSLFLREEKITNFHWVIPIEKPIKVKETGLISYFKSYWQKDLIKDEEDEKICVICRGDNPDIFVGGVEATPCHFSKECFGEWMINTEIIFNNDNETGIEGMVGNLLDFRFPIV